MSRTATSVQVAEMALGIGRRGGRAASSASREMGVTWCLGLALFVGVALRLLVLGLGPALEPGRAAGVESDPYLVAADAFSSGSFLAPMGDEAASPAELTTPLYPALVAVMGGMGLPLFALLVLQTAAWAGAIVAAYVAATSLGGHTRCGMVAAIIVAIHPAGWVSTASILPDSLAVALLCGGIYVATNRATRGIGSAVLGGGAIGLAVLAAPLSWAIGPVVACWMAFGDRRLYGWCAAIVFAVSSIAPGAAWMARHDAAGVERPDMTRLVLPAPVAETVAFGHGVELLAGHGVPALATRLGITAPLREAMPASLLDVNWGEPQRLSWYPALGWIGLTTLLTVASLVGGLFLLLRRHYGALLLSLALLGLLATAPISAEPWRGQAFIALPLALLAAGIVARGGLVWRRRSTAAEVWVGSPGDEPVRSGRPL